MAMATGDTGCTTGLSKRIYDLWQAGFAAPVTEPGAVVAIKAMAYGVAKAVVDELVANSEVVSGGTPTGEKVR